MDRVKTTWPSNNQLVTKIYPTLTGKISTSKGHKSTQKKLTKIKKMHLELLITLLK